MQGRAGSGGRCARELELVPGWGAARARLDGFIRERFWRCHGARPARLLDGLLGIAGDGGQLIGAGGLSLAGHSAPLFLEAYLDEPVDRCVSRAAGQPVERTRLAEIGNLAVDRRGTGVWMMAALAAHAGGAGRTWGVFTATTPLRRLFEHVGAPLLVMDPADPARLPVGEAARWGSYYDTDPRVCAAPTADFVAAARERWPELASLCDRARRMAGSGQAECAA